MPDGDVDHVDPVRAEHPPHLGNPVVEPLHRDEVLLQHVGLVIPRARLQLRDVVARLAVAPAHRLSPEHQRVHHVLPEPAASGQLGHGPEDEAIQPVGPVRGYQAIGYGDRLVGPRVGDRVDGVVAVGVDVRVVEDREGVVPHLLREIAGVVGDRHHLVAALDPDVPGEVEGDVGDDAQPAVAAYDAGEDLRVHRAARLHHGPVREHDPQAANGTDQRSLPDVAAVHVDRYRAADREVGVGLHDLHGEIVGVERLLDLAPPRAGLDGDRPRGGIQRQDAIEPAHVDLERAGRGGLSPHAVAPAADGDGALVRAHRLDDLLHRRGCDHALQGHRVESGDVVDHGRPIEAENRRLQEVPDRDRRGQQEECAERAAQGAQPAPDAARKGHDPSARHGG